METISGYVIRVVLVDTNVAHHSVVTTLNVSTLDAIHTIVRASLVSSFKLYSRLILEANLTKLIILARVVVIL